MKKILLIFGENFDLLMTLTDKKSIKKFIKKINYEKESKSYFIELNKNYLLWFKSYTLLDID